MAIQMKREDRILEYMCTIEITQIMSLSTRILIAVELRFRFGRIAELSTELMGSKIRILSVTLSLRHPISREPALAPEDTKHRAVRRWLRRTPPVGRSEERRCAVEEKRRQRWCRRPASQSSHPPPNFSSFPATPSDSGQASSKCLIAP